MTLKLENKSNLTEMRGKTIVCALFFLGKTELLRLGSNTQISGHVNSQRHVSVQCVGLRGVFSGTLR